MSQWRHLSICCFFAEGVTETIQGHKKNQKHLKLNLHCWLGKECYINTNLRDKYNSLCFTSTLKRILFQRIVLRLIGQRSQRPGIIVTKVSVRPATPRKSPCSWQVMKAQSKSSSDLRAWGIWAHSGEWNHTGNKEVCVEGTISERERQMSNCSHEIRFCFFCVFLNIFLWSEFKDIWLIVRTDNKWDHAWIKEKWQPEAGSLSFPVVWRSTKPEGSVRGSTSRQAGRTLCFKPRSLPAGGGWHVGCHFPSPLGA